MAVTVYKPEWGAERPIRGVLFDMDGLVLDSEVLFARFWREAARCFGFPMTQEQALGMRSLSKEAGQAQLISYFGPAASYSAIRAKRIEIMDAFVAEHGIRPKPGIHQLLDQLHARGIRSAITSSSPPERIREYLTPLDLYSRFDKICSGHDVPQGKPAPDIYLLGAAELGLSPSECLALEDSPAGILSAYRAGCLPVMIPDLDQPGEETLPLLYAKADSLSEIPSLLDAKTRTP